jgi:DNA-directed RNA polymerase sigma subunit (sigma70/sigma32)
MAVQIKNYEKLITSIANEHKTSGVPLDQLIIAGQKGLSQAIELSKENSAFDFNKSVSWFIRQSILKSINEIDDTNMDTTSKLKK